ncbi:O-succinylhomoserine sulfhydrylase [Janibacter sp. HTCC2649]|uniref:hypothetical protein n=1 Tax=Janibacter sp. HTCC2649 TaxID=313589 RepID=UPI000066E9A3|nr:hypothetical protein [Janibacter sp. HTCC2649]EAP99407.1 O-succinylhomoserine sulfhydrylase [Janibacter sp. HTCC2649]
MPSYRVTVDILDVRAGVQPQDVLPAAESILARTHQVEDRLLDVAHATSSRPQPQLHLRFLVPATERGTEDAEAKAVAGVLVDDLDEFARCGRWELRRGPGRSWRLMAAGIALSEQ